MIVAFQNPNTGPQKTVTGLKRTAHGLQKTAAGLKKTVRGYRSTDSDLSEEIKRLLRQYGAKI